MILATERTRPFRPGRWSWTAATLGCIVILWTFVVDTSAGLLGTTPEPYHYGVFFAGLGLIAVAIVLGWRHSREDHFPALV